MEGSKLLLRPSTLSMLVIGRSKNAIYLRLSPELQLNCGGCSCDICKKDPSKAKWDTLCVPISSPNDFSHTVHCPDSSRLPHDIITPNVVLRSIGIKTAEEIYEEERTNQPEAKRENDNG